MTARESVSIIDDIRQRGVVAWVQGRLPWRRTIVMCACLVAVLACVQWIFTTKYILGATLRDVNCIPGTVFVISRTPPDHLERGQLIGFITNGWAPYPPDGLLVVKVLAGVPGDHVRVDEQGIWINGKLWGPLNDYLIKKTYLQREALYGEYVLAEDEVLVLGTLPNTYDSRYKGPIKRSQLVGTAWRVL